MLNRALDPEFEMEYPAVAGLTPAMLREAVRETYAVFDTIDSTLTQVMDGRFAQLVELANLSSILGNVLAETIVSASGGVFTRAGPHKYQDLRPAVDNAEPIEIKVALETNRPKGHLAKPGHYLSCRYVLADREGNYTRGERGNVVWLWELRLGRLSEEHFSLSNTEGDSGKTAVVTVEGLRRLCLMYFDPRFCPYADVTRYLRNYGPRSPLGRE